MEKFKWNSVVVLGRENSAVAIVQYAILMSVIVVLACGLFVVGMYVRATIANSAHQIGGKEQAAYLALATAVAGTIALFGFQWLGRRKKQEKTVAEQAEEQLTESSSTALQMRLYAKRQHLFLALLNDSDILLKNQLLVRHLMTRDLIAVEPNTKREEMIALMDENRTHHLLVCHNRDQLLGVVSDRDLSGRPGKTAWDIMTSPPVTVAADSPLNPAVTYLINKNISCLPVLDDDRLCGVITRTDLILTLQCTIQSWLHAAQQLREDLPSADELIAITKTIDDHLVDQQTKQLASFIDMRIDSSTGLGSRRGLEEVLNMLLTAKDCHRTQFSLAVIKIEQIEAILDAHGDDIAERVIKTMAEKIQQLSRKNDFIARYQYNALAVVLTQTGLDEAHIFCNRIREQTSWYDSELETEVTLNVATVDAWKREKPTALLARAEAELIDSEELLCTAG